jgi:hypothetical protein
MADPLGVSIAFDATPLEPDPTWTRIDTLDGCRVRDWQIDRGRPDEFSKTGTGTATVHIVDRAGLFDPTGSGTYTGNVKPGKQAAISLYNPASDTWHTLFRGFVEAWAYQLDQTRQYMELELQLVDGFAVLEQAVLQVGVDGILPLPAEIAKGNIGYGLTEGTMSDRIYAILGTAGLGNLKWPEELAVPGVDVFSGNVRLGPKAYGPGTSALDALWDAADGEFPGVANMWIGGPSAPGHLIFHGRQARFRPDVAEYNISRWTVADPSAWGEPMAVPIAELEWSLGNDNLYNAASATPQGIVQDDGTWRMLDPEKDDVAGQYVKDDASIGLYGLRSITFDQLQTVEGIATGNDALVETKLFATYYFSNYNDPQPRISKLTFKTRRPGDVLGSHLWQFMCNVDISDLLTVKTQHPGGGGFDAEFYVEGIHYTGQPGNPDIPIIVELSLDVSPQANWTTNPFPEDGPP